MEELTFSTTQNVDILSNKAGVGDRFIAGLVDYLILTGLYLLLSFLISDSSNVNIYSILMVLFGIIFFFYHFFTEIFMNGQSIGKKYRNIKVMHQSGRQANAGQYFIRALLRPIDFLVGLMFIAFTPKSQRLGDLAAGTIVIKLKDEVEYEQMAYTHVKDEYKAKYPQMKINKLKPSDIELIKEVLGRAQKTLDYSLVKLLFEKTKSITGIEPKTNAVDFLNDVIKDYNSYNG